MSNQTAANGFVTIATQPMHEDWGFNDKELDHVQLSFQADFYLKRDDTGADVDVQPTKQVTSIFSACLGEKKVTLAGDQSEDVDEDMEEAMGGGFNIHGNDIFEDDQSIPDDDGQVYDSFTLSSSEKGMSDFAGELMISTDRLTADPFATSENTDLTVRVETQNKIDRLVLALLCDEHDWLKESNRPQGRLSPESCFSLTTFREAIVFNFLMNEANAGFSKHTDRTDWVDALNEAAEAVDDLGCDVAIEIEEDGRAAYFTHIGGPGYETDFERNHRLSVAMARSVARSAPKRGATPWEDDDLLTRLEAFIDHILAARENAKSIELTRAECVNGVKFMIQRFDRPIGVAKSFSPGADRGDERSELEGALVIVGNGSSYAHSKEQAILSAELLHSRP